MEELKPCPFCGSENLRVSKDELDVLLGGKGSIFCKNCCSKSPVSKWNSRSNDVQLAAAKAEIVELKSDLEFMCEMSKYDAFSNRQYKRIAEIRAKHKGE